MRYSAAAIALVVVAGGSALAQQQKTRNVMVRPDTPIRSLVLADDELLTVEIGGPGIIQCSSSGSDLLTLDEEFRYLVPAAHVIVVAEAVRSESMLVRDGTWIDSYVTLAPTHVIKDTNPSSLESDGSITIRHSGGEMQIDAARVRANYYHVYDAGERYLVFIRKIGRGPNPFIGTIGVPFRVTSDERLGPMMVSTGKLMTAQSPLHGMSVETVIEELTRRANMFR